MVRRLGAALVHAYTASGAVLALLALVAAVGGRLREAFFYLAAQIAVDATDGFLARLVRAEQVMPDLDGGRLDDIVDYLTYVFVPAAIVVVAGLVPGTAGWIVASAMLVASAFGFARTDAKTADHFFTGFPSYWNIVVFYLVAFRSAAGLNAVVLAGLAVMVFVPVRYVYPSRTPILRGLTIGLGLLWAALMLSAIAMLPDVPVVLLWASLIFPVYYVAISLALDRRRRSGKRARAA